MDYDAHHRPPRAIDVKSPACGAALQQQAKHSLYSPEGAIWGIGWRTGRQNPRTVSSEGKSENTVEVDVFEAYRGQLTQRVRVHLALTGGAPVIERGLPLMCIPGHDQVCDERECARLRAQFFHAPWLCPFRCPIRDPVISKPSRRQRHAVRREK
jgi:hypothetical protein